VAGRGDEPVPAMSHAEHAEMLLELADELSFQTDADTYTALLVARAHVHALLALAESRGPVRA
jgi:hypothetical protein